ncbi:MAG: efflux RND transporter periplasmic adaptor subunit [bacterium]|nr:efflux RND transporter periplasmic adaptor subunit [bacterium]
MSKTKKRIIWIIIILAVIAGSFFFFRRKRIVTIYTTEEAKRGNLSQTVSVTGTINPEMMIDVAFKGSGILKELNVDLGDMVKKNQKIARLDLGTLTQEFREAQEDLNTQRRELANMKKRKVTYNTFQENAQRARIRKAEEAVRAAQIGLKETIIYSPIDGKIIKKNFEQGENISANSSVATVSSGELQIESNIPESDIVKIALDQNAEVTLDALSSDEKFKAKVIEIEPASTVIQDVVYYKVKLRFNAVDSRLKVGMSSNIDIKTAEKNNVIFIPLRAVKTEGGKKYAEVLKDKDKNIIEKVSIATGLEGDEGMVEITSGLKGGENVITLSSTK